MGPSGRRVQQPCGVGRLYLSPLAVCRQMPSLIGPAPDSDPASPAPRAASRWEKSRRASNNSSVFAPGYGDEEPVGPD